MRSRRWLALLGGAAGLTMAFLPAIMLNIVRFDGHLGSAASTVATILVVGGIMELGQPHGALVVHAGSHWAWDYGATLAIVPGFLAVTLMAPMIGYRRRDALMVLVPVLNIYIAWMVGGRAAQFGRSKVGRSSSSGADGAFASTPNGVVRASGSNS